MISRRHVPSKLHSKGLWVLLLVLLSESITFTNSVTFWSRYNNYAQRFDRFNKQTDYGSPFQKAARQATECAASDGTCTATPSSSSSYSQSILPRTRIKRASVFYRRPATGDCCFDCFHCTSEALALCRGGDIAGAATDAVKAAASATASASSATVLHTPPYNIPLNGWKVIFQVLLTALNIICWLVPLRAKAIRENKLALSLANAFSGGVFLSLAFGHLIPECVEGFEGSNDALPYMMVLGGYLLIFFVEKVAFDAEEILDHMKEDHDAAMPAEKRNGKASGSAASPSEKAVVRARSESGNEEGSTSGRGAVILLAALAMHSILEMSALGLAKTWGDAAIMSLSIALHQPAESIALLVAFLKSGLSKGEIFRFLMVFSMMGPVGVALGMAVNEFASPSIDSMMLAIVAGTFVYVGATEVIPEEWENQDYKWHKFVSLLSGIVTIFFITQYTMTLE